VIVVIGNVAAQVGETGEVQPSGFAALLASEAAASGSKVEIVTRLGDDAAGDAVLLALAQAGVGHVATFRDAGLSTPLASLDDPEKVGGEVEPRSPDRSDPSPSNLDDDDLALALRYLSDFRVLVLVHPPGGDLVREARTAAAWAGAHLVLVTAPDEDLGGIDADGGLVLSADAGGVGTATLLGRYAAAIDSGEALDRAYAVLTQATTES
jgi:hypothetical protein